MITKAVFSDIDNEVKTSVQLALETLRTNNPSSYVLFLANGEYDDRLENVVQNLNPFIIDSTKDIYKDETRLIFLTEFLSSFYSFRDKQSLTDDNKQRMHVELMIYSHIWEAKPFLKKLYRLAHLSNGEDYHWKVQVPDMGKHEFIRNNIRVTFENTANSIAQIIKKGFHTSLRNAFAHSDYSFDTMGDNRRIWLDNYNGSDWEIQYISFDDWSIRFSYSVLLSYYLLNLVRESRTKLVADFGVNEFKIKHISKSGSIEDAIIVYREEHDDFKFKQNLISR
jgi:hypothetical protein